MSRPLTRSEIPRLGVRGRESRFSRGMLSNPDRSGILLRTANGRGSTTGTGPFVVAFSCSLPRAERWQDATRQSAH